MARKYSKKQLATLKKYGYFEQRSRDSRPLYGKGSRGASEWNIQQKAAALMADEYNLTPAEKASNLGYLRRIRNVINLAKKDEKVREIMNRRLAGAEEIAERLGYKDITDLTTRDIQTIMEATISEGGLINIPSFANPKLSDGTYAWESA